MSDWPQIIIAAWLVFSVGAATASTAMVETGAASIRQRGANNYGWLLGRLLGVATLAAVLYAGGFWA